MIKFAINTAIAFMLGAAPSGVAAALSDDRPVFPAGVEMVTVDVVVVDDKGNPIAGLRPQDFLVEEDGNPQTIEEFDAIDVPEPSPLALPTVRARVSSNTDKLRQAGRTFVIVFDGLNLEVGSAEAAKKALKDFLEKSTREGDLVAFIATQSPTWWFARIPAGRDALLDRVQQQKGLKKPASLLFEYMSDYEAMRIAEYEDYITAARVWRRWREEGVIPYADLEDEEMATPSSGQITPAIMSRAQSLYAEARHRIGATLDVVRRILDAMRDVKGRKSMLLLSDGFVFSTGIPAFRQVNEASRRSNTVIYYVDAGGLRGLPGIFSAASVRGFDTGQEQDVGGYMTEQDLASSGAAVVAEQSGGFAIHNTNALGDGMARIARESQSYYLIGYRPTNTARDGAFRKISVEVNRRDVKVRARKGYYAPGKGAGAGPTIKAQTAAPAAGTDSTPNSRHAADAAMQRALDSPYDQTGIPLRMTADVQGESQPGKAKVLIVADVDVRDVRFSKTQGRFSGALEILLVAAHRESGEFFRYDQKLDMNLLPETHAQLMSTGYTIIREFDLVAGGYQARLIVRDPGTGVLGSITHDFQVPETGKLRCSTPILTDTLMATQQGVRVPKRMARRTFASQSMMVCQFEVFDAAVDPVLDAQRVSSSFALVAGDGATVREWDSGPIKPDQGRVARTSVIDLAGLTPGDYQIVIHVKDEVADHAIEVAEPFQIVDSAALRKESPSSHDDS
jgi:VWFA-related protein